MGTILSLDYGTVRVGVAISDEDKKFALALKIIPAEPKDSCIQELLKIINDENVEKIVIGLPLGLDGQEGVQAMVVRNFVEELKKNVKLPTVFIDERFSTKSSIEAARMKGAKYPDAEAARLFLDTWLQTNNQ